MQATDFKTRTSTRTLALIIIFISLAIALNVYGPKIPFPIAPFLYFQLWEIPIVVAFLAIGPKAGVTITVINSFILLAVFPGGLPTGPLYNLGQFPSSTRQTNHRGSNSPWNNFSCSYNFLCKLFCFTATLSNRFLVPTGRCFSFSAGWCRLQCHNSNLHYTCSYWNSDCSYIQSQNTIERKKKVRILRILPIP
jgi:hypothetical protein